jgi:predicted alpha/beta-fold hydrolase
MTEHSHFQRHPLLLNGHLQTLLGIYLPSKWKPEYTVRRLVRVEPNDHLVVHDNCPDEWNPRDRVAVMLHGLGGCSNSGYMQRVAAKLNAEGIRTMRVDMRGFGASKYSCRQHAHIGRSEDLEMVLQDVTRCCPRSPVSLIGFSFGGNIVCKLLAEYGSDVPDHLDSAVVVSPPIDLIRCAQMLRYGLARFYDKYFVYQLKKQLWERRKKVRGMQDVPIGPLPDRLREFDNYFTAPLNGFRDATEYYTMCSTAHVLDQVSVKTLILAAADDPIIPVEIFETANLSPAIELLILKSGGHLGFVSRKSAYKDRRWMDWQIVKRIKMIEEQSVHLIRRGKSNAKSAAEASA